MDISSLTFPSPTSLSFLKKEEKKKDAKNVGESMSRALTRLVDSKKILTGLFILPCKGRISKGLGKLKSHQVSQLFDVRLLKIR